MCRPRRRRCEQLHIRLPVYYCATALENLNFLCRGGELVCRCAILSESRRSLRRDVLASFSHTQHGVWTGLTASSWRRCRSTTQCHQRLHHTEKMPFGTNATPPTKRSEPTPVVIQFYYVEADTGRWFDLHASPVALLRNILASSCEAPPVSVAMPNRGEKGYSYAVSPGSRRPSSGEKLTIIRRIFD